MPRVDRELIFILFLYTQYYTTMIKRAFMLLERNICQKLFFFFKDKITFYLVEIKS